MVGLTRDVFGDWVGFGIILRVAQLKLGATQCAAPAIIQSLGSNPVKARLVGTWSD